MSAAPGPAPGSPAPRPSGLGRLELLLVQASTLLVGGTGLVYAVMRYLMAPADEFSLVSHPAQPEVQHLHVLLAPLLVFAAGVAWARHARPALRERATARRGSGLAMLATLAPMVASGYLLQVAGSEAWRAAWGAIHTLVSLAWLAAFLAHQLRGRGGRLRR